MLEYTIHPAADLFPMISGDDMNALAADIEANGLQVPIATLDGQILDGRNRLEACTRANVAPTYQEVPEGTDSVKYICSANIHRRHLNDNQRAAIAAELANLERGGDRRSENFKVSNDPLTTGTTTQRKIKLSNDSLIGTSIKEAADMMNSNETAVKRAKKVMKEDPEAHEAAKRGKKTTRTRKPRAVEPPKVATFKINQSDLAHEVGLKEPGGGVKKGETLGKRAKRRLALEAAYGGPIPSRGDARVLERVREAFREVALQEAPDVVIERSETIAAEAEKVVSLTDRQKLNDAVGKKLKAEVQRLEYEADLKVREQMQKYYGQFRQEANDLKARVNKMREGSSSVPFTEKEFRFLVQCVHPDHCPADKQIRFTKAFNLLNKKKDVLMLPSSQEVEGMISSLPDSVEEMLARRKVR